MKSVRLISIVLAVLLVGCASTPSAGSQPPMLATLVSEGDKLTYQGGCSSSLRLELPAIWRKLGEAGIAPTSNGIFLFTAGDSYIFATAEFAGSSPSGYRIVSSTHAPIKISRQQFEAIEMAASIAATADPKSESLSDHDACEFVVINSVGGTHVAATMQSLRIVNGVKSYGGFEVVRQAFEIKP